MFQCCCSFSCYCFVFCFLFVDLYRRTVELDERKYLMGRGVVTEMQSNMGETERAQWCL